MANSLEDLTQALVAKAKSAGADYAEAMAVDGTAISVGVHKGALEKAEREEGTDLGLRVIFGQRQACVSASATTDATLNDMVERASGMAKEAPEDHFAKWAEPGDILNDPSSDHLDLFDPAPETPAAQLKEQALALEIAASQDPRIAQVSNAAASYTRRNVVVAASNGFHDHYSRTNHSISCVAVAGEGTHMVRDFDGDSRVYASDLRSIDDIGAQAAERTINRLDARKPPTGNFPIVFDERVSNTLVGHLLSVLNGAAIARGVTWLPDAVGQQILPKGVDLIEDPFRKRLSSSRVADGEGLATTKRKIVSDGIIQELFLDLSTAARLGLKSTASAQRRLSSPPSPGAGNLTMTQGSQSRADLIADAGTGLLVTSMMGATINPTTGDYSRGASGFWIENGQITYAVHECTIAGNLKDMLPKMIPGNDARTHLARVVPSILIEGMTLAGE